MKSASQQLFECVYQWGRVGIVIDHHAPTYVELLRKAADELPQDFYEALNICPADGDVIDGSHDYVSPDGRVWHSRDCANEGLLMESAI